MKNLFKQRLKKLVSIAFVFDEKQVDVKLMLLKSLSQSDFDDVKSFRQYHDILIFLAAYPSSVRLQKIVESELKRMSMYLKKSMQVRHKFQDSGMPFTIMTTRFSHDLLTWMQACKECSISFNSFDQDAANLNEILRMTLPALEKDETTASLNPEDLLIQLGVPPQNKLKFLLNQFDSLDHSPLVKDYLWESLKVWVNIEPTHVLFSTAYNRVKTPTTFFQHNLLKKFDHVGLIQHDLPTPTMTSDTDRMELIGVIKKSLILTMRETDPSTFVDEKSVRYYELDRGISVAIYGMKSDRQLPLQSYIGYTLFKNGYPAAYGGSWIFGKAAMFGLNIFETFRGGESGYMMCQLLRVYHQAFGVSTFEVEPYQFGLDNPDGIQSGAYWFYYRYGFRSVDKKLNSFAEVEYQKIKTKNQYRTSASTLMKFTSSNLVMQLSANTQIKLLELTSKIANMIRHQFDGDRALAINTCVHELQLKAKEHSLKLPTLLESFIDFALLAKVVEIRDQDQMQCLQKMIKYKPLDPYKYNHSLSQFLAEIID